MANADAMCSGSGMKPLPRIDMHGQEDLAACKALPQAEPTGNAIAVAVHGLALHRH